MATEITELQHEYVEWMSNPQREGSKAQWARDHGIHQNTLQLWEKSDWYTDALEASMRQLHLSMDKVLEVVRAVHKEAAKGNIQAAKLYLQFLERVQPMKTAANRTDLPNMTDDELQAALEGAVD